MLERELNPVPQDASQGDQLDIKNLILRYLRYWYLFVGGITICLAAAFFYLRYTTKTYNITGTLVIRDDKMAPELAENAVLNSLETVPKYSVDTEIEVLQAKSLMKQVLEELNMHVSYFAEGNVKKTEVYGSSSPVRVEVKSLLPEAYGKTVALHFEDSLRFDLEEGEDVTTHAFGKEITKPYGKFTVYHTSGDAPKKKTIEIFFNDLDKLANNYNSKLSLTMGKKSVNILTLNLVDAVPEKGVDILNKLIEIYTEEAMKDKSRAVSSTLKFIDERLTFLTAELSAVEKSAEEYMRNKKVTDSGANAGMYVGSSGEYTKQLADWGRQIGLLESIEQYLKSKVNQHEVVPSTLGIADGTLAGLLSRFNELQLERKSVLRTVNENHPAVISLDSQLANMRESILENLRNIKNGLVITRNNLQANLARSDNKVQEVPVIQRELQEISRLQAVKQELYIYLLKKKEESELILSGMVSNSRVIDSAWADPTPLYPIPLQIYGVALLIGFGLPFGFVFLKGMLNSTIQQVSEVEQMTKTPILGELSHNDSEEVIVVNGGARSAIAELFRLIRTNLRFTSLGKENKVLLVTSSMSGEGKTFFAINLAASLAVGGKRVVILDYDLRKPGVLERLGMNADKGLANLLLSDGTSLTDVIRPVNQVKGLFVVGAGPMQANPAELLMDSRNKEVIDAFKELFDYVIVDTSPVGQVADALAFGPYVDSTIYVVRYNYTNKAQIKIIDDIFRKEKLSRPMIVMNDSKKHNGYSYTYGYGYGYTDGKSRANKADKTNYQQV